MADSKAHTSDTEGIRFVLVWLDAHVNNDENRETNRKLSREFGRFRTFENTTECQKFLEDHLNVPEFVLIVSGQLGLKLVPLIHEQSNISSIYVYCGQKELNERWASKFSKVKAVITVLDELISKIKLDHKISTRM